MTIALFPGKFQPPHIGHIQTLMNIYPDYDKIIVGITEDNPSVLSPSKVKKIFESILKHLPKFEVILIKGTIEGSDSIDNLPDFDILLSGNQKVIDHVKKFGKKADFTPRTDGVGCSGTELRSLFG